MIARSRIVEEDGSIRVHGRLQWLGALITLGFAAIVGACSSALPAKYLRQVEPDVTLTALVTNPERYRGRVIMLGGVLEEEKYEGGRLWLHVKNRPLDRDYRPHRPPALVGPEAGQYWVVVAPQKIPATYRKWARMTVVGLMSEMRPMTDNHHSVGEPVLTAMYIRGWSPSAQHDNAWEEFEDPQYQMGTPGGLHGEFGVR
jgi:starvation-inducible outer membrane lipoprotein